MIKRLLRAKKAGPGAPELPAIGTLAPGFRLQSDSGEWRTLSELRGRPTVLVFYPADDSSVCSNQLALYNEALTLFEAHGAQLVGISVDDHPSHQAFARRLNLGFPLLSDDDPAGEVARAYGVFSESHGTSERALFVLDADGRIQWRTVAPRGINPGANGILEALESLDTGA